MKSVSLIIIFFLITQFLGLYVGSQYLQAINAGEASPALPNPESVQTSFYLFGYMMVSTTVILILIKFKRSIIRVLEAFVVFTASWITFDFLIPLDIWYLSLGFFLALALTAWKVLKPTILNQDIAAIISGAGVGAILGSSLGVVPSIVFMLVLSVYDYVSVFITKHMVYMAKAMTERPMSFTVAAPHKFKKLTYVPSKKSKERVHVFQLGVGDMVIPLMFSVSVLGRFGIISALASTIGSTLSIIFLVYFISKKPQALPALPFITFGTLAGFLVSLALINI